MNNEEWNLSDFGIDEEQPREENAQPPQEWNLSDFGIDDTEQSPPQYESPAIHDIKLVGETALSTDDRMLNSIGGAMEAFGRLDEFAKERPDVPTYGETYDFGLNESEDAGLNEVLSTAAAPVLYAGSYINSALKTSMDGLSRITALITPNSLKPKLIENGMLLSEETAREIKKYQGKAKTKVGGFAVDVTQGVGDMAIPILAGVALGPAATATLMGTQMYGQKYNSYMDKLTLSKDEGGKGLTREEAHKVAHPAGQYAALAEGFTELMPATAILSKTGPFAKKLINAGITNFAQESIMAVFEQSYDANALKDMTLAEAIEGINWGDVAYQGLVGLVVGSGLAATTPTNDIKLSDMSPEDAAKHLEGKTPAERLKLLSDADGITLDNLNEILPEKERAFSAGNDTNNGKPTVLDNNGEGYTFENTPEKDTSVDNVEQTELDNNGDGYTFDNTVIEGLDDNDPATLDEKIIDEQVDIAALPIEKEPTKEPKIIDDLTPEEDAALTKKAERSRKQSERQTKNHQSKMFPDATEDDAITYLRKHGGIDVTGKSELSWLAGRLKHLNGENKQLGLYSIEQKGKGLKDVDAIGEVLAEGGYIEYSDIGNGIDGQVVMDYLMDLEGGKQYSKLNQKALDDELAALYEEQRNEQIAYQRDEYKRIYGVELAEEFTNFFTGEKEYPMELKDDYEPLSDPFNPINWVSNEDDNLFNSVSEYEAMRELQSEAIVIAKENNIDSKNVSDILEDDALTDDEVMVKLTKFIEDLENVNNTTESGKKKNEIIQQIKEGETNKAKSKSTPSTKNKAKKEVELLPKTDLENKQQAIQDIDAEVDRKLNGDGEVSQSQDGNDLFANDGKLEPDLFSGDGIQQAADKAATSKNNNLKEPTNEQKEDGTYKKGRVNIRGIDVAIENPKGTKRQPQWPTLQQHYGYIEDTKGADGDEIDVFIGDNASNEKLPVFVINQTDEKGNFDEHKVMLGFASKSEAKAAYLKNYTKGWTVGPISKMDDKELKNWIETGDKSKPTTKLKKPSDVKGKKTESNYGKKNKVTTESDADKARAILKSKLGQLNSGLDPEIVKAGITLSAYHVEAGAIKFTDFVKAMKNDLGKIVSPYLKSWYMAVKYDPNFSIFNNKMSSEDEVNSYVSSTDKSVESDSKKSSDGKQGDAKIIPNGPQKSSVVDEPAIKDTGKERKRPDSDSRISKDISAVRRTQSNSELDSNAGEFRLDGSIARGANDGRANTDEQKRISNEYSTAKSTIKSERKHDDEFIERKPATLKHGNLNDIKKSVPTLFIEQQEDVEFIEKRLLVDDGRGVMITNGTGTGKLQPLTEPVLTAEGWVTMGDIKPNDMVICPITGSPIKVLKTFPQENLDIYRVEFDDGTYTECCNDHLWQIRTAHNKIHGGNQVVDLNHIIEKGVLNKKNHSKFWIPLTNPVRFNKKQTEIDPYLLGLLLGDGYLPKYKTCTLTSHSDIAEQVYKDIHNLIPKDVSIRLDRQYGDVKARKITFTSKIKEPLSALGLLGKKSRDKFIPNNYLYNSINVRKRVLAGLLDTDSNIKVFNKTKKKIRYSTMSTKLKDGVIELVRSLGGVATASSETRAKYNGGKCWSVSIRVPFNPYLREEKHSKFEEVGYKQYFEKAIRKVEFLRKDKGQCILVDSDQHLYITRSYTVTHNTFTGLGTIKRFIDDGKNDVLIITPSDAISKGWVKEAKLLNLDLHQLKNTKDKGEGVTVTTYANFISNKDLFSREFNLIVTDESHTLNENAQGDETKVLSTFRAITGHEKGKIAYRDLMEKELVSEIEALNKEIKSERKKNKYNYDGIMKLEDKRYKLVEELREKTKVHDKNRDDLWSKNNSKVLFLSATPFAYEKNIAYAESFLFDYPKIGENRGYNTPNGYQSFMIDNFGYSMKYDRLTTPDAQVDSGLMQREFNERLKSDGVLRGREINLDQDYSREFISIESLVGQKIDEGINYISDMSRDDNQELRHGYQLIQKHLENNFKYHEKIKMLEAIKARAAIPRIKQHLELGRKVVLFHSRIKGGLVHPFKFPRTFKDKEGLDFYLKAVDNFNETKPDLVNLDLHILQSPIDLMKSEFGDNIAFFNGTESKGNREKAKDNFNNTDSVNILMVQDDAGKTGISLHDTKGLNQRALINIGLPMKPTQSIQIEGRIYRIGQLSDAVFEYFNTGTNFEALTFADKIAGRSGTAENLAMGNKARGLTNSFIDAFEDPSDAPPSLEQGKGGKKKDKQAITTTPFDRAKSYYFGQQKNRKSRANKEGNDYFATPEPLGFKMAQWADIRGGENVLEPSAGHGAIARFLPSSANITVIEPSPNLAPALALRVDSTPKQINFEDHNIINKYDSIVMNPPFGRGGKTAMEHLSKAIDHLNYGGRIVAIIPTGTAADKAFNKMFYDADMGAALNSVKKGLISRSEYDKTKDRVENTYLTAEINLPPVTFTNAGTKVSTKVVIIDKVKNKDQLPKKELPTYINTETINEFFDTIENIDMPPKSAIEITADDILAEYGFSIIDGMQNGEKAYSLVGKNKKKHHKKLIEAGFERDGYGYLVKYISTDKNSKDALAGLLTNEEVINSIKENGASTIPKVTENIEEIEVSQTKMDSLEGYGLQVNKSETKNGNPVYEVSGAGTKNARKYLKDLGGRWYGPKKTWSFYSAENPSDRILDALQNGIKEDAKYSVQEKNKTISALGKDGLTKAELEQFLRKKIGNRAYDLINKNHNITIVEKRTDLPKGLQRDKGMEKGVYSNGKVYLVAENITLDDAYGILLHEVGVHAGLENMLGVGQFNSVLERIGKLSTIDSRVMMARRKVPSKTHKDDVNEETLAYLIQDAKNHDLPILKRLFANIRSFFRKLGLFKELSVNDIAYMVEQSLLKSTNVKHYARAETVKYSEENNDNHISLTNYNVPIKKSKNKPTKEKINDVIFMAKRAKYNLDRAYQDKFIRLNQVEAYLKDNDGKVDSTNSAYSAETRFSGKVETDFRLLTDELLTPFYEKIARSDIEQSELDEFLIAKHAHERNDYIASINEKMPDGGSGLTNAQASAILQSARESGRIKELEDFAKDVYKILEVKRAYLQRFGLLSDETLDTWQESYKHYVPLKGFDDVTKGEEKGLINTSRTGKGLNVSYKEPKALGRNSLAASPLTHAISDTTSAIIQARKNEVGQHFLKLVMDNPDPNFWKVFSETNPDKERTKNAAGEVVMRNVTNYDKEKYFHVKYNGKQYYIRIHDADLIRAMGNLGLEQQDKFIQTLAMTTRYLSAIVTSYDPQFVVSNFVRDFQTALFNLNAEVDMKNSKTMGENIAIKAGKGTLPAINAIYKMSRNESKSTIFGLYKPNKDIAKYYDEFREDGAKTGFFDSPDLESVQKNIDKMINLHKKTGFRKAQRGFVNVSRFIEDANTAVENGIRLSAYIEARKVLEPKIGVVAARKIAATLAKNLTVNFNRRGEKTTTIGAIYQFFNASVQGIYNGVRFVAGSQKARKTALAIATASFFNAMLNRAMSEEDEDGNLIYDNIPSHIKERNAIFMNWSNGKEQSTMPLPYGYNIFWNIGTELEAIIFGPQGVGKTALNLTSAFLGSFNPIGGSSDDDLSVAMWKSITPTIAKPTVELFTNSNFFGGEIYREKSPRDERPRSSTAKNSTPEFYKSTARNINRWTGGTESVSGKIDAPPELFKHYIEWLGGGVMKTANQTITSIEKKSKGIELEYREIPFLKKLYRENSVYTRMDDFFTATRLLNQIDSGRKSKSEFEREENRLTYGAYYDIIGESKSVNRRLYSLYKQRIDILSDEELSDKEKDVKIKNILKKSKTIRMGFLKKYDALEKELK